MNPLQWLITYSPIAWLSDLSAHQLDVLRTTSIIIGSALVPLLTFLLGWGVKLLRTVKRDAEAARKQTVHSEYIDGKQHPISVVDYARNAADSGRQAEVSGAATRQEVSDLAGWVRGAGKRRQPTNTTPIQERSHYE